MLISKKTNILCKSLCAVLALFITVSGLSFKIERTVRADYEYLTQDDFEDRDMWRNCVTKYDTDGDGMLSKAEVLAVTEFDLSKCNPRSCSEISYFINATSISIGDVGYLSRINITRLNHVTSVRIYNATSVESIVLGNLPSLKTVEVINATRSQLSIYFCENLTSIHGQAALSFISMGLQPNLTEIDIKYTSLKHLDLSHCNNLQTLSLDRAGAEIIFPNNPEHLETLYLCGNDNATKDFSSLSNLKSLTLTESYVESFDTTGLSSLTYLDLSGNKIEDIDLSGCPDLQTLVLSSNKLTSLDLSHTPNLKTLWCQGNDMDYLNINGCPQLIANYTSGNVSDNGSFNTYYTVVDANTEYDLSVDKCVSVSTGEVTPLREFINRLYRLAMYRTPDEAGVDYWVNAANNGLTGADIARSFLYSDEFINNRNNTGDYNFVSTLYNIFFDRESADVEEDYWVGLMHNQGVSRQQIIDSFINSDEWVSVCENYGIPSGAVIRIKPNEQINAFVSRLYTTCLGRTEDPDGLASWADHLANREISGTQIAYEFFFSDEFTNKNCTDVQYIQTLYRTLMGREATWNDLNYWGAVLASSNRSDIFYSFANSDEFLNICNNAGINR